MEGEKKKGREGTKKGEGRERERFISLSLTVKDAE